MTLFLHRAERTDLLADGLADLLGGSPLADPFARELVVVPARGVERWLTQRLAHRLGTGAAGGDGVCAGVDFASPRSLVSLLLGREKDDPWDADRLVWPLLEVVDEAAGEEWCAVLTAHLGLDGPADDVRRTRRYAVARRLAGLLSSYAVQRPQLVTDWREGRSTDGLGGELPDDLLWQPELWRRLVARVGGPAPDERHARIVEALREGDIDRPGRRLELPPRLSLFGHTRIACTERDLIAALAEHRDVHLWLPQASATAWERLAPAAAEGAVPRDLDESGLLVEHPLLASLGRDSRELQRTLATAGAVEVPVAGTAGGHDSVLGWLQHDLRHDAIPDASTRLARRRRADDRSVQVHACHGAARQVDVLREVLVGLLADDPTLEPRDILVMCPDVEAFAPLIAAAFGMAEVGEQGHPGHRLRVRLADRALSSTNPLLGLAATLVELAGGRLTATEVLDLAGAAPVRARFGFEDDEIDRIRGWIAESGVRWGFDAGHRGRYGLDLGANTWAAGLDRVLLGVAVAGDDHRFVGSVLPLDDVGSGDIDLVGRFTELLDRVHAFAAAADAARSLGDWARVLRDGVSSLARAEEPWQATELERELGRLDDGAATHLGLADVRALLAQRLGGRPTRASFRTGTLTVCTMVPMRSVPHRVVALLGLDDGVFPRTTITDGDDALARRPVTGERDARAEDRQLLLDAVMAATETLVVTYTGAGEHTGSPRPPAVPLGELLEAVALTTDDDVSDLHVHHPLQPFDEKNLVAGALVPARPFSFDAASLVGAEASRGDRADVGALCDGPLAGLAPAAGPVEVGLAELQAFFQHPVRGFLRDRLGLAAPLAADPLADAVPIELDALERWAVGDRLVRDVLAGMSPADGMTAELLRGLLPPGALGQRELAAVVRAVQPLVTQAMHLRSGEPRAVDIDVALQVQGRDVRLTGTVADVFGPDLVTVTYSSLGAKQRFGAWLDLLALSVAHPDHMWRSHALGKHRSGAQRALAGPLDDHAEEWLRDVVDVWLRGQAEPLPLPPKTALAYAEESARLRRGADARPDEAAARKWVTDPYNDLGIPGEDADAWHVRAFGAHAAYEVLTGEPRPDERWDDEERHRLGQYAWRLWGPLVSGAELVRAL
ncbi:exodeoxyribonuclease V subunit gamma [Nocardioides jiangxiensis]|uniref:RecBCD enzyme subunit RecC n=1 Tax=Nocardioides jiangxiensis TaxID=3064524 RepID=A0ABT9B0G4_9ACTN|nr:exodeoxyribonuclease V subunit gamma [Nocardioides sp. WY-20]MDO7868341.1 exodeoxyribonuclease V subunit gamma [Nocardioides sp. WY-20]